MPADLRPDRRSAVNTASLKNMKYLPLMIFLILASLPGRACGQLELKPVGASERKVSPGDFVTVTFEASGAAAGGGDFILSVETNGDAALVSATEKITLIPGAAKKIPLTFSISSQAVIMNPIPVRVSLSENGVAAATAEIVFIPVLSLCAGLKDLEDNITLSAGAPTRITFKVVNCGQSKTLFTIKAEPSSGVDVSVTQLSSPLEPGAETTVVAAVSVSAQAASSGRIKFTASAKNKTVSEKTINYSFKKQKASSSDMRSRAPGIRISTEKRISSTNGSEGTARISIPKFGYNGISMKSDLTLDTFKGAFSISGQTSEFSAGNMRLVYGNQSAGFSSLVGRNVAIDGAMAEWKHGAQTFRAYQGGNPRDEISMLKMENRMSKRITASAGVLRKQTAYGATTENLLGSFAAVSYAAPSGGAYEAEIASTKSGATGNSGIGFRFSARTQLAKTRVTAEARTGGKGFSPDGFLSGYEFRANRTIRGARLNYSVYRRAAYNRGAPQSDLPGANISKGASYGITVPAGVHGLSLTANISTAGRLAPEYAPTGASQNKTDKRREFSLAYNGSRFINASLGVSSGSSADGAGPRSYDAGITLRRNSVKLGVNISGDTYPLSALGSVKSKSLGFSVDYEPPGGKNSFGISWNSETSSDGWTSQRQTHRTSLRYNLKLAGGNSARLSYDMVSGVSRPSNLFSISFNRSIEMPQLFDPNGAIAGIAYIDSDGDSRFGDGDAPLEQASIYAIDKTAGNKRVGNGKKGSAISGANGGFEMKGLAPGEYVIEIDNSSLPAGLTVEKTFSANASVKPGKKAAVNIPLIRVYNICGAVVIDEGGYFNKNRKTRPSGVHLLLAGAPGAAADAYSASDGSFCFDNVRAGKYEVSIDAATLPENTSLAGNNSLGVECSAGPGCAGAEFHVQPKKKSIVTTFQK